MISSVDQILNFMLFWTMFLKLDGAFAVRKAQTNYSSVHVFGILGLLIQVFMVYFINGLTKTGISWEHGYAVQLSAMDEMFQGSFARWLIAKPTLAYWMSRATGWFELIVPFLLFVKWRRKLLLTIIAPGLFVFHFGIGLFLELGPFPLITFPLVLLLFPFEMDFLKRYNSDVQFTNEFNIMTIIPALTILCILKANLNTLGNSSRFSIWIRNAPLVSLLYNMPYKTFECCSPFNQNWTLFAPDPSWETGVVAVIGKDNEGHYRNLHTGEYLYNQIKTDNYIGVEQMTLFADNVRYYFRRPMWSKIANKWANYEAKVYYEKKRELRLEIQLVLISKKAQPKGNSFEILPKAFVPLSQSIN